MPEPVHVYHLTNTGDNGETLQSLFEQRATTQGPDWIDVSGQRNGFFVRTNRAMQDKMARVAATDDGSDEWIQQSKHGEELLATVECDFRNGWEIDYEDSAPVAKLAFFEFQEQLADIPAGEIKTADGFTIQNITIIEEDERDGLEITTTHADLDEPYVLYLAWDEPLQKSKYDLRRSMSPTELIADLKSREGETSIAEPGLLQVLRDHLVNTLGDTYRDHETMVISNAIASEKRKEADGVFHAGLSLKYNGDEPLDIIKIETMDSTGVWKEVESPPVETNPEPHILD